MITPESTSRSTSDESTSVATPRLQLVTELVLKAAERIGARVFLEPRSGFAGRIQFLNGKSTLFRYTSFDVNGIGASDVARDKDCAAFFMSQMGYSVPEGRVFLRGELDSAVEYARQLGYPVFAKPNLIDSGRYVFKALSEAELLTASKIVWSHDDRMLVQRYYPGNDFRIVIFDDELITAHQRLPLAVRGDGRSSVQELLVQAQDDLRARGRDTRIDSEDSRIEIVLMRRGFSMDTVLDEGQELQVLDNANLSTGGEARDVTELVHNDWVDLAASVSRDMGLTLCGVDVIAMDITAPISGHVILEINATPSVKSYARSGSSQMRRILEMYERILLKLQADADTAYPRSQ